MKNENNKKESKDSKQRIPSAKPDNSKKTSSIQTQQSENSKASSNKSKGPVYKQIKLLGQGSFGKAFLVENTTDKVR